MEVARKFFLDNPMPDENTVLLFASYLLRFLSLFKSRELEKWWRSVKIQRVVALPIIYLRQATQLASLMGQT